MRKYNNYAIFLIVLFLISIIPLIILSFYNHPSADDYSCSMNVFHQWNETHSVKDIFISAIKTSKHFYSYWQGLYSSIFFLALQPAVFGEKYYAFTAIIMLFLICGSTVYFSVFVINRMLKSSVLNGVVIGCAMSFLIIQYMPSCVEGIYWYNGAMNYGLFYAIMLLLIANMINLQAATTIKSIIKACTYCYVLGFLVEGGNHVTAFMSLLSVVFFIITNFYFKDKIKIGCFLSVFIFMTGCFFLNISSPGTKVRAERLSGYGYDFFPTIGNAIKGGINKTNCWTDLILIAIVIITMPIIINIIIDIRSRIHFKFSNPLLVFIGSIAWICAMYCPPLYAMGYLGEGRLNNIVYYNFIILFFLNIFYITGWIIYKLDITDKIQNISINNKWNICVLCLIFGILVGKWDTMWSVQAVYELKNGEAQEYSRQANERNITLLKSAGTDVVVQEYTIKPLLLYFDDITDDPDDWRNSAVTNYYNLNSIILEHK